MMNRVNLYMIEACRCQYYSTLEAKAWAAQGRVLGDIILLSMKNVSYPTSIYNMMNKTTLPLIIEERTRLLMLLVRAYQLMQLFNLIPLGKTNFLLINNRYLL